MSYHISIIDVEPRPTAVIPATTTWPEFPALWGQLSGEVWACLRAGGVERGCPNVMVYHDDTPRVEIGVLFNVPCPLTGRVVESTLPAGQAAMTVHHGPYAKLGSAHDAVVKFALAQGRQPTRTRWEIYGPHREDPAELTTEVYWLLA